MEHIAGDSSAGKRLISFIIPALNEEESIPQTIDSISKYSTRDWDHEVIVVDHGSTDRTREIAAGMGARVLMPPALTIGALRNFGARQARGTILVFLDADVALTAEWQSHSSAWLPTVLEAGNIVSGAKVLAPHSSSAILKHWFAPLTSESSTQLSYLGSAHLIMPRAFFECLGGFDERLKTGEDYDLCERARKYGAAILPHPQLKAFHNRFPTTFRQFIRRERWHGTGDTQGLGRIIQSKVALMTIAFVGLHGAVIVSALASSISGILISSLMILGLLGVSILKKFSTNTPKQLLYRIPICYTYYIGRALAFLPSARWQ